MPPRSSRPRARAAAFSVLSSVLILACSLAGCSAQSSVTPPDTVTFLIEAMPTNLDPRIGTDAQSQHLDDLIFSSLVARDSNLNTVPDLAESWETPDPLTYIFHLRRGVKFHNGAPLTSADVKFTFDSILDGAVKTAKRGSFRMVDSIAAPDDATVVFHLREPYASFLWNLSRPGVGIVPRGSGPEVAQHPIGTGPFRFVSLEPDEDIVLERNPDYFGVVPKISRVRFRVVPDATVRALELRKGTADVASPNSLTPDMVVTLARYPGIAVTQDPGTQLAYMAFNFDDPILAKRDVRQALAYATDRESIIKYLLRGQARLADSLLPPNHWAYDGDVEKYDYDPAKAEALLDAAGLARSKDGTRLHLTLKTSTEESTRLYAEVLQEQWRRVGIVLELRPQEFATFYSDITHGSFQLYTQRWVGGNNDPDIFEFVFSSHKFPPDGANRGHYRNPQLDALLDRSRVETDREKRRAILVEVQRIVAADLPYLNLWYVDNTCVHRDRVKIDHLDPNGDYDFLEALEFGRGNH
ncbi:MAG: ABC transporter substrate-binding protein [Candidatus Acidiferrales bacterium]